MIRKREILWEILLIFYILFIFSNSLTPAKQSSADSGAVLAFLREGLQWAGMDSSWLTEHIVRKCAHFGEYAVMGILLWRCIGISGSAVLRQLHMAAVFFIPFVDETLQLFTEGRSGQISDVWLDMSGTLAGLLAAYLFGRLAAGRRENSRKG